MDYAQELAEAVIEFDRDHPGEDDADLNIPFDTWQDWKQLAIAYARLNPQTKDKKEKRKK